MNIPFSPPDMTQREADAVAEALKSGWITTGPRTKKFEKLISTYCGTNKSACLNSATAALELTLLLLGIGPGDEVITTPYTYTASASVIFHTGARIVMCDTAPDSYEMNYNILESLITPTTKAIIPVDIGGVMCNYRRIEEIVNLKKNLFYPKNNFAAQIGHIAIIADASHSFGAKRNGIPSGSAADFTCFSFHAVKNLTTAEGGAVTWKTSLDDEELYRHYMLLSLHGQSKDALAKNTAGAWEYDIIYPAYKCNMTDIMAAIGTVQLERYGDMLKRRHSIADYYNDRLSRLGVESLIHSGDDYYSSAHLYMIKIKGQNETFRGEVIRRMAEAGVSANVHYKPLPMMTAYKNLGYDIKNYPNSYRQYENEITLPLYSTLSDEAAEYVCDIFIKSISG